MLGRLGLSIGGSGAAALLALLVSASPTIATCFGGGNEGALGTAASQAGTQVVAARGVRAQFLLRPAVPNNDFTAIAHPTQAVNTTSTSVDFLGLGTYKSGSQATPPGCAVNGGPSWKTYADGTVNGVYFCTTLTPSYPNDPGVWHTARLNRAVCGSVSTERWCFYLDGVFQLGKNPDFTSGAVYAGSESVGTTITQNLKLDYRDASRFDVSGTWHLWAGLRVCEDPPYFIDDTAPHTYKVTQ